MSGNTLLKIDLANVEHCLTCALPMCVHDEDAEIPHYLCPIEASKRKVPIMNTITALDDGDHRCNCGHTGPAADFTTQVGKLTRMCSGCRQARAEKMIKTRQRKQAAAAQPKPEPAPTAIAPAELEPALPDVEPDTDDDEPVALALNRRQIEKLTTMALRQLVQGDSRALAKRLPALLDLVDG